MQQSFECLGYRVLKLWCRAQKKRKRVNGRARGFYEGVYIYVRVKLPDGTKRDLYLGRPGEPAKPGRKAGVEKKPADVAGGRGRAPKMPGWRNRGEKAPADDTRDSYDARQSEMFGGARRR